MSTLLLFVTGETTDENRGPIKSEGGSCIAKQERDERTICHVTHSKTNGTETSSSSESKGKDKTQQPLKHAAKSSERHQHDVKNNIKTCDSAPTTSTPTVVNKPCDIASLNTDNHTPHKLDVQIDASFAPAEDAVHSPSDFSDVMRDVLGVLDRDKSSNLQCARALNTDETRSNVTSGHTALNDSLVSDQTSLQSGQPAVENNSTDRCKVVDVEGRARSNSDDPQQQTLRAGDGQTKECGRPDTELKVEIPITTSSCDVALSSPSHKPIKHRQKLAKRKRRRTVLGLLCCGLGRNIEKERYSPPFELPVRTEGTLPRSESASPSKHSPTILQQSDVTGSDAQSNGVVIKATEAASSSEREVSVVATSASVVCSGDADAKQIDATTELSSIIDVLCASEKPITLHIKDNKDLVSTPDAVTSASSVTAPAVDVTQPPPVIQGVRLMRLEKVGRGSLSSSAQSSKNDVNYSASRAASSVKTSPDSASSSLLQADQRSDVTPTSEGQSSLNFGRNQSEVESSVFKSLSPACSETLSEANLKQTNENATRHKLQKQRSQSLEDLATIGCDVTDGEQVHRINLSAHLHRNDGGFRSSFIGKENLNVDKTVYGDAALQKPPGEVQTLMKQEDEGQVYALPQPACYSDDTLKAVKLITNKYDTLERWKERAHSFRGGADVTTQAPVKPERNGSSVTSSLSACSPSADAKVFQDSFNSINADVTQTVDESIEQPVAKTLPEVVKEESDKLSETEVSRIKLFYSSRTTDVTVCRYEASLYLSEKEVNDVADVLQSDWSLAHTGVPVLVLHTGQGRERRHLLLVIAERETTFPLWQDTVNHLSQYRSQTSNSHSMRLSRCLLKCASLKFHSAEASDAFMHQFTSVTSNPDDDLWKLSVTARGGGAAKRSKNTGNAKKLPVKLGDISQPIQFAHLTNVTSQDKVVTEVLSATELTDRPPDEQDVTLSADVINTKNP